MKRYILCNDNYAEDGNYSIEVTFNGFVGCSQTYEIFDADSREDAVLEALDEAAQDLTVENCLLVDEGTYEVEIGFAGLIGASEFYTVDADSEDEAIEFARVEAEADLSAE